MAAVVLATAVTGAGQPAAPDLSGTWKLDATRSRVTQAVALVGLVKTGAPETLHITQAANGTVIVESHINESQSRLYKPGSKSSTPVVPAGTITMTSRWDGRRLVSEGTFEAAAAPVAVTETFALAADGQTLTIDVTTAGSAEKTTLLYVRIETVGSCRTWPTPCKM